MDRLGRPDQEDGLLLASVKYAENTNWEHVSDCLLDKGFDKTPKQCRER